MYFWVKPKIIIVVAAHAFSQISLWKSAYINSHEYAIRTQFHQAYWKRAPHCSAISASAILSETERQEFKMTPCCSWDALTSKCCGFGCYCECQTSALKILIQMWLNQAHKYEGGESGVVVVVKENREKDRKAAASSYEEMKYWAAHQESVLESLL